MAMKVDPPLWNELMEIIAPKYLNHLMKQSD